jgi:hypothetical protein
MNVFKTRNTHFQIRYANQIPQKIEVPNLKFLWGLIQDRWEYVQIESTQSFVVTVIDDDGLQPFTNPKHKKVPSNTDMNWYSRSQESI